ncbi:hypothetical protein J23TS9_22820 [Paenibacillus sp. J23TS9]|nr:hypothetical protein J23TS9_22820 [Paenibacillus sp. J23TS9]
MLFMTRMASLAFSNVAKGLFSVPPFESLPFFETYSFIDWACADKLLIVNGRLLHKMTHSATKNLKPVVTLMFPPRK